MAGGGGGVTHGFPNVPHDVGMPGGGEGGCGAEKLPDTSISVPMQLRIVIAPPAPPAWQPPTESEQTVCVKPEWAAHVP